MTALGLPPAASRRPARASAEALLGVCPSPSLPVPRRCCSRGRQEVLRPPGSWPLPPSAGARVHPPSFPRGPSRTASWSRGVRGS
jgi:hypothetical protein